MLIVVLNFGLVKSSVLTFYLLILISVTLRKKLLEDIVGKRENADNLRFLLFSQCFLSNHILREKSSASFLRLWFSSIY